MKNMGTPCAFERKRTVLTASTNYQHDLSLSFKEAIIIFHLTKVTLDLNYARRYNIRKISAYGLNKSKAAASLSKLLHLFAISKHSF